jgi:hypothetical protein
MAIRVSVAGNQTTGVLVGSELFLAVVVCVVVLAVTVLVVRARRGI